MEHQEFLPRAVARFHGRRRRGLPKGVLQRRLRAAAPRNVPHLPARDELGGAMTAPARQPTPRYPAPP